MTYGATGVSDVTAPPPLPLADDENRYSNVTDTYDVQYLQRASSLQPVAATVFYFTKIRIPTTEFVHNICQIFTNDGDLKTFLRDLVI